MLNKFIVIILYSTTSSGLGGDIKIHILSNNVGYYFITMSLLSSSNSIWKYLFSSSTTAQCQTLPGGSVFLYGQLMISDTQLFYLRIDSVTYDLHFYQITFGSATMNWAKYLPCSSTPWMIYPSESLISTDGTTIYNLLSFGNPGHIYFTKFDNANGSLIGSRYKSSFASAGIKGSTLNGDNIAALFFYANFYFMLINISTLQFTIFKFNGSGLHASITDPNDGR